MQCSRPAQRGVCGGAVAPPLTTESERKKKKKKRKEKKGLGPTRCAFLHGFAFCGFLWPGCARARITHGLTDYQDARARPCVGSPSPPDADVWQEAGSTGGVGLQSGTAGGRPDGSGRKGRSPGSAAAFSRGARHQKGRRGVQGGWRRRETGYSRGGRSEVGAHSEVPRTGLNGGISWAESKCERTCHFARWGT